MREYNEMAATQQNTLLLEWGNVQEEEEEETHCSSTHTCRKGDVVEAGAEAVLNNLGPTGLLIYPLLLEE